MLVALEGTSAQQCVCADGFTAAEDKTSCECKNYLSADGKSCVTQCPAHQKSTSGACACTDGYTLAKDGQSCECKGYVSLDRASCVEACDANQAPVQLDAETELLYCACTDGYVLA